jgi:hypothetical protein
LNFDGRKRKYQLTSILAIKMDDLGINEFYLIRRVSNRVFFDISIAKDGRSKLTKFFFIRLI